jgi:uncharacterized protein
MTSHVPVLIADTSALIAFFNSRDPQHKKTRSAVSAAGHLVVSPCVLAELDYLIASRQGAPAALGVLGYVSGHAASGRWSVPAIGHHLQTAHAVLSTYPEIGLTDAINVVLARVMETNAVATLDQRHFRMIRPLTRHDAFRLLPADD